MAVAVPPNTDHRDRWPYPFEKRRPRRRSGSVMPHLEHVHVGPDVVQRLLHRHARVTHQQRIEAPVAHVQDERRLVRSRLAPHPCLRGVQHRELHPVDQQRVPRAARRPRATPRLHRGEVLQVGRRRKRHGRIDRDIRRQSIEQRSCSARVIRVAVGHEERRQAGDPTPTQERSDDLPAGVARTDAGARVHGDPAPRRGS